MSAGKADGSAPSGTFARLRAHLDARPETRVMWQPEQASENALVSTVRFLCDLNDQREAEIAALRKRLDGAEDDGR